MMAVHRGGLDGWYLVCFLPWISIRDVLGAGSPDIKESKAAEKQEVGLGVKLSRVES